LYHQSSHPRVVAITGRHRILLHSNSRNREMAVLLLSTRQQLHLSNPPSPPSNVKKLQESQQEWCRKVSSTDGDDAFCVTASRLPRVRIHAFMNSWDGAQTADSRSNPLNLPHSLRSSQSCKNHQNNGENVSLTLLDVWCFCKSKYLTWQHHWPTPLSFEWLRLQIMLLAK
jgi:hypothetical protein